jgi:hypothetical protein
MPQKFATFQEACNYKVDEKRFECGGCTHFIAEEQFLKTPSNWGTCQHHSHAFIKFRRACYSFEKKA